MLELNKIYKMDCLKGMKEINDNSIDLIVTDPPYLINYKSNRRIRGAREKTSQKILNDKDNIKMISEYLKEKISDYIDTTI